MPIYLYKCGVCDNEQEEFHSMSEESTEICSFCGSDEKHRIPQMTHNELSEYFHPTEMHSMALCHADDIADFKRRYPDVECSSDPKNPLYGVPLAANRSQKLQVLKGEGWVEQN